MTRPVLLISPVYITYKHFAIHARVKVIFKHIVLHNPHNYEVFSCNYEGLKNLLSKLKLFHVNMRLKICHLICVM